MYHLIIGNLYCHLNVAKARQYCESCIGYVQVKWTEYMNQERHIYNFYRERLSTLCLLCLSNRH